MSWIGGELVSIKTGHWNEEEKIKYLMFIEFHYDKMKIKENRRLWRIFKIMSEFIQTRNSNQCRSHHKKMETHFESIPEIINYYKDRIPNYQEHFEKYLSHLEKISFGIDIKGSDDDKMASSRINSPLDNSEDEKLHKKQPSIGEHLSKWEINDQNQQHLGKDIAL